MQIAMTGSHSHQIARSINWLKNNYTEPLRVKDLANLSGMSTSTFHHHANENLGKFEEPLPDTVGNPKEILEQLNLYGAEATVSQIGGRYFGFVNGGVIPTSLAARWLSDVWDQNSALYVISPLASKLEEVCEIWLRDLFGLPDRVVAGFVSGSSLAIFCGIAAGRYRIFQNLGWDINKKGFYGAPQVRVVAGRQAHGTVIKAIPLLGFGIDNIEWVDTDNQGDRKGQFLFVGWS